MTLLLILLLGGQAVAQGDFSLDRYQWQNRLIVLAAPSADDSRYAEQLRFLTGQERALNERDLIIIRLLSEGESRAGDTTLNRADAASLRKGLELPESFQFLLIGKDGGVKHRSDQPVSAADLYSQIDAMPMRQREMRDSS